MNINIIALDSATFQDAIPALGEILTACVHQGASVGFVLPFSHEAAAAYWQSLVPTITPEHRHILVAVEHDKPIGTIQLVLEQRPNGLHRAEISKLLVHPQHHRRGLGRTLMLTAEELARQLKRKLLVLDTAGEAAEQLYTSLGYNRAGVIPDFAMAPDHSKCEATTLMYKRL